MPAKKFLENGMPVLIHFRRGCGNAVFAVPTLVSPASGQTGSSAVIYGLISLEVRWRTEDSS
jgi:hypothetical protein